MNVYFNNDDNFCDEYGCTVSGYVNDYIEGEDSLSLCQVQETGEVYFDEEPFKSWISLSFELPEVRIESTRPPLKTAVGVDGRQTKQASHVWRSLC